MKDLFIGTNTNIEIDGRNFYDQSINENASLKKKYRLIAADLSKQKTDSRAIQQIIFTGKIKSTETNTRVINYYILELSKETILEFAKGTTKVLSVHING